MVGMCVRKRGRLSKAVEAEGAAESGRRLGDRVVRAEGNLAQPRGWEGS